MLATASAVRGDATVSEAASSAIRSIQKLHHVDMVVRDLQGATAVSHAHQTAGSRHIYAYTECYNIYNLKTASVHTSVVFLDLP